MKNRLRLPILLALAAVQAPAAEIHVMTSGGFNPALTQLAPQFERQTGDKLVITEGASMGTTPTAIPVRLAHGEPADVVILARTALDSLVAEGKVVKGSEVDLVRSRVGFAVKSGTRVPDISTVDGLKQALLKARSIAYSDSASGVYVSGELFKRLGIADQVASKSIMIPGTPVGLAIASGKAEVGFQQMSELLTVAGIKVVGPIPESVQKITIFSAGIAAGAKVPEAARKLIEFLSSPQAAVAIRRSGAEPIQGVFPQK